MRAFESFHTTHCSYLDICISRIIRLFVWNSDLLYSILFYFLQDLSNPVLFAHCHILLFQRVEIFYCDLMQKCDSNVLTILKWQQQCAKSTGFDNFCKKIEKNLYNRSEFPDQKVKEFALYVGLKFTFQINCTKPDFLWNVNAQIATVCAAIENIMTQINFFPSSQLLIGVLHIREMGY